MNALSHRISRQYSWPDEMSLGATMTYRPGTVLFHRDDRIHALYAIVDGIVNLAIPRDGCLVHVTLGTPGHLLGAYSAIRGQTYAVTAIAIGRCIVRQLSIADFHRLRTSDLRVSAWLEDLLAEQLHDQLRRCAALAASHCAARLERLFLDLFQAAGERRPDGSWRLMFDVSVTLAAELVLVSRPRASAVMSEWAHAGTLIRERGWLIAPAASPITAMLGQERP